MGGLPVGQVKLFGTRASTTRPEDQSDAPGGAALAPGVHAARESIVADVSRARPRVQMTQQYSDEFENRRGGGDDVSSRSSAAARISRIFHERFP